MRDGIFSRLSNQDLLRIKGKMRKEKKDPSKYGKYGSSRYVTATEFYRGSIAELNKELERRKASGKLKKSAGKSRRTTGGLFGNYKLRL